MPQQKQFNWSIRVYYEDTDASGVVYYANYLKFMERARSEWLRSLGFEQDALAPVPRVEKTDDHTYALLRLTSAQYDHPARDGSAGGSLVILTWEAQIGR